MISKYEKRGKGITGLARFAMIAMTVMAWPQIVQAAVLTYPGSSPCNTTLQVCIDGANAGDTVEIATNTPIDESLDLSQSLTLRSAAGFAATLAANNSIIASSSGTTNNAFTIQDMTFQRGRILITHGSTGTLTVNIHNNVIEESFTSYSPPIQIRAGNVNPPVMGDISFSILNNQITVSEDTSSGQTDGISIQSGNNPAATGLIKGNTIVHQGCSQCAAINLANGSQTLMVDVIGNNISGTNYRSGISLFQFSPAGSTSARIMNNLITGQNGNVGWPAAISINGSDGTTDFLVMNNTVADNRRGVLIGGRADLGGVMAGDVVNNIVVNNESGLSIDSDFASTIDNSYNLVFNNDSDGFTPGPGTLTMDPQFVGGGNYRLSPGSRAVNAGNSDMIPADVTTDLDDNPRLFGGGVDMGAYELQRQPLEYEDVIIDFGVEGVKVRYNDIGWSSLHPASPEIIAVGDIDGSDQDELIIDFGSSGIWVRLNNTLWIKLHPTSPELITTGDMDGNGQDEVIIDFGPSGIWVRMNNTSWSKLHPASPDLITTGDMDGNGQDDVIIDFGPSGIWVRMNNTSWMKLHPMSPELITTGDMDGSGQDDVIIDFGPSGIWVRMNNTSWTKLHPTSPDSITTGDLDGNGQDDVIIDFGNSGTWVRFNNTSWTKLHPYSADEISTGDMDGNGQDEAIIDFGSSGIWVRYNNTSWSKLHNSSSEIIATGNVYSRNNVAFVTSVTGDGNLSAWADAGGNTGLAAGDAICQARADAAGLAGTFVAWLSDDNDDAYCRIHGLTGQKSANCGRSSLPQSAGPWVRTDGYPFAEKAGEAFVQGEGYVYTPLRYDEFGHYVQPGQQAMYHSATDGSGTLPENNPSPCSNWTSGAVAYEVQGSTDTNGSRWSDHWGQNCVVVIPIVCFQTGEGPALPDLAAKGKKVFLTSVTGTGDLSSWPDAGGYTGVAAGDAVCQARAQAAGLANASSFKAWLSDSTTDAIDRLTSDGPWVRLDGVTVADNKTDLTDGTIFTSISLTETGEHGVFYAWTGTEEDGIGTSSTCNDWTDGTTLSEGTNSHVAHAGEYWSGRSPAQCSFSHFNLYCFED